MSMHSNQRDLNEKIRINSRDKSVDFIEILFFCSSFSENRMSLTENIDGDIIKILSKLKTGSILTKRKRNGEKYCRKFFLDEHEGFLSYHQSEKVFSQSHRCKFCFV